MKQTKTLLIALLFLFTFMACEEDGSPIVPNNFIVLSYDGDNLTAPQLPGATYEAAARFTAGGLQSLIGAQVVEVDFYIVELPQTCEVKVYSSNGGSEPGTLIYSADVRNGLNANSWNKHELTLPHVIGDEDIWIAVRFSHASDLRVLGCDPGPAVLNGDWLFDSTDSNWTPLTTRTGGSIDINWNIRANVDPN